MMSEVPGTTSGDEGLLTYLLSEQIPADMVFSAEAFYPLVTEAIYGDDQEAVAFALQRFAAATSVEFAEPTFSDEEFTKLADAIEREVSDYIMENEGPRLFGLMGVTELSQVKAIYNANNMLFFAKELIKRADDTLTQDDLQRLYRYRKILKRLEEQDDLHAKSAAHGEYLEGNRGKIGALSWPGRVRAYGIMVGGLIDPVDHSDFDEAGDDAGRLEAVIDGQKIRLRGKDAHYAITGRIL